MSQTNQKNTTSRENFKGPYHAYEQYFFINYMKRFELIDLRRKENAFMNWSPRRSIVFAPNATIFNCYIYNDVILSWQFNLLTDLNAFERFKKGLKIERGL